MKAALHAVPTGASALFEGVSILWMPGLGMPQIPRS